MAFGNVLANSLLGWFKGSPFITAPSTTLYLSLHSGEPGPEGTANDVTAAVAGGRGAFALSDLGAIANSPDDGRQITLNAVTTFTGAALAPALISHVGIWNAASDGSFYGGGPLTQVASVLAGDIVRIPSGSLRIRARGYANP